MTTKPRQNFQNIRAVGFEADPPFVNFSPLCWSLDCTKPGSEIEFLNMTLQVMESTATIIQVDADIEQSIAMVANGSADMTLNAARQTVDRMKIVDFTTPIGFVYYGYFLKEIPEIAVADYIISIFYLDTLALLISSGIAVGSLVFLYCWIFDKRIRSLTDWMIVSCAAILRQFMFRISSPVCAIVLIGVWLWCCLGWTMVIQESGYTPYLWCNPSQCARLDKLKSKTVNISSNEDFLKYVVQDKHVGFNAVPSDVAQTDITYYDYQKKILFVRDKITAPEFLSFAVSKNVKGLREAFNRAVSLTTSGYDTVRTRYLTAYPPYDSSTGQTQMAYVLQTQHFMQLYKFCLFAYGFSTLVLLTEILIFRLIRYFKIFGHTFTYRFSGYEWRFIRPKWVHFPRRHTVILPIQRSYERPQWDQRHVTIG